jgi:hypothetical protein
MGMLMYLMIYLITVLLILNHNVIPKRFFFLIWFVVMFYLSLSIRWSVIESNEVLNDGDLSSFVNNMKIEGLIISYFLKEPVFWFGIQFLYGAIGNAGLVFVVVDAIMFVAFYKAVSSFQIFFKKKIDFDNLKYLYFGAVLCYPFMAGMHNHYRQILAVIIAFYAIGLLNKNVKTSFITFLVSIAIHNAMIVLSPMFLLVGRHKISSWVTYIAGLAIAIGVIIPLFFSNFGYDGWYEINRRLRGVEYVNSSSVRNLIYLFIMIFSTCSVAFLEFITKGKANYIIVAVLAYMSTLYGFTVWFLPDQASSRIFFLVLTLLYILFGLYIETKFKADPIVRLVYFHITLIPLLGLSGDGLVYYFF